MSKPVIIFGNSDFAKTAYAYFKNNAPFEVCAFCVDDEYKKEDTFCGLPMIPYSKIDNYPPEKYDFFIAIGYNNANSLRKEIFEKIKLKGYHCVTYIHPTTIVENGYNIGENCFIGENNFLQVESKIKDNVIIWGGSGIAHNVTINSHCFLCGSISIAGYTTIDEMCFIGLRALITENLHIGKQCIIGANSFINRDLKDYSVCIEKGTPLAPINSKQFVEAGFKL